MEQNLLSRDCITRKMAKQSVFLLTVALGELWLYFQVSETKNGASPRKHRRPRSGNRALHYFFAPDCLY